MTSTLSEEFIGLPRLAALAFAKHFKRNDELFEISWEIEFPHLAVNNTPPKLGFGWGDYAGLFFWTHHSASAEESQITPNDSIDALTPEQWDAHIEQWTKSGQNFKIITHEEHVMHARYAGRFDTGNDEYRTPSTVPDLLYYSQLEISPCTNDADNCALVCHPAEASFYTLYGRIGAWGHCAGTADAISNHPDFNEATQAAKELEAQYPHLTEQGGWEFSFNARTKL